VLGLGEFKVLERKGGEKIYFKNAAVNKPQCFPVFFSPKLDEKSHFVGNMTKIKNCGVKPFRKMASIKILLLCYLAQIIERNEQAYWEGKSVYGCVNLMDTPQISTKSAIRNLY